MRWLLRSRLPRLAFLTALGPGLISGFADNDAGGITTYSVVGAQFGYDLMWVVLGSMIALSITQEVGARLGLATGQGFGGLIRQQYGVPRAAFAIGVMLLANLGDTVAEFAGIGAALARLFGLPGLPVGRRETTPQRALVRAACVRGFLGSPDLIVVQDQTLDQTSDLAVPLAQAISAARDRGAAVLWITASLVAQAAQFVQAEHLFRLGEHGLVRMRRSR